MVINLDTVEGISDFLTEISGRNVTSGYIGNIEQGGDYRSWRFFQEDEYGCRSYGYAPSAVELVKNFNNCPKRFVDWAREHMEK